MRLVRSSWLFGVFFLGAGGAPVVEVVRGSSSLPWIGLLAAAIMLTAATFIAVLLACGMRNPVL